MEDPHLDANIARLDDMLDQLRALRESTYDVADVMALLWDMFGDEGVLWLFRSNPALGDEPVRFLLRGQHQAILQLLRQVEAGVYI